MSDPTPTNDQFPRPGQSGQALPPAGSSAAPTPYVYAMPPPRPAIPLQRLVSNAMVWGLLIVLAAGLLMALFSLNEVISVWFEYQWEPVARLVMGLVLVVGAITGVAVAMRKRT